MNSGTVAKLIIAAVILLLLPASQAFAATFNANDHATLVSAINSANANTEDDTINITADITLTANLPNITKTVTVNGNGNTIDGAIAIGSVTTVTINRSAIFINTSNHFGGGIHVLGGNLNMNNVTVYGNTSGSGDYGGGIHIGGTSSTVRLKHVTITKNTAVGSAANLGGGIASRDTTTNLHLENSIVYGNTLGDCSQQRALATNSGNIFGSVSNCGPGTGGSSDDPQLPANASGNPPHFALPAGSPAIDAVSCITGTNAVSEDQRGTSRPQGSNCDIGAYEYEPPAPPQASFTAAVDPANRLQWTFDASASTGDNISAYEWDFGDGNTATGQSVSHTYASDGNYRVTLTVRNTGGSTSASRNLSTQATVNPETQPDVNGSGSRGERARIRATPVRISPAETCRNLAAQGIMVSNQSIGSACQRVEGGGIGHPDLAASAAGGIPAGGRACSARLHGADEGLAELPRRSWRGAHHRLSRFPRHPPQPAAAQCHADGAGADGGLVQGGLSRDAGLGQR